jgi:hypothetical protein
MQKIFELFLPKIMQNHMCDSIPAIRIALLATQIITPKSQTIHELMCFN